MPVSEGKENVSVSNREEWKSFQSLRKALYGSEVSWGMIARETTQKSLQRHRATASNTNNKVKALYIRTEINNDIKIVSVVQNILQRHVTVRDS